MRGGLNLSANKEGSCATRIAAASVPPRFYLPLNQHAESALRCIVSVGQRMSRGQPIAIASDEHGAWLHAPVSGTILAIEMQRTPNNLTHATEVVVLANDGEDRIDPDSVPINSPLQLSPTELRHRIARGGIVGLGGAVFSTAEKLAISDERRVRTLIVNGAECEPFIACDDALMRERANDVIYGAQLMLHACGAEEAILAVESDKPEAIAALRSALGGIGDGRLRLVVVAKRYPAGGERQLIQSLTGNEVPGNGLPADIGVLCQNVGTVAAIAKLIRTGEPLISRIVTVTGSGIREPRNLEVRFGTPLASVIADCGGYIDTPSQLIMGGSMMGIALPNDVIPVVKSTNCVIAATAQDFHPRGPELPCIRCGDCATTCPAGLLPQELLRHARSDNYTAMRTLGLNDCIECGCCDYVCPSQIPLTATFISGKRAAA